MYPLAKRFCFICGTTEFKRFSIWNNRLVCKSCYMRMVNIGRKFTKEHRAKIALCQTLNNSMKGKTGALNPFYGRKHTDEFKAFISRLNTGRASWSKGIPKPIEVRAKIALAHKGRTAWNKGLKGVQVSSFKGRRHTPEAIEKNRLKKIGKPSAFKGKRHTPNTKEKMRLAKYANPPKIFKNTKPERVLEAALIQSGITFEKQKRIYGLPDFFIEPNVCIFVDGDYIHANPDKYKSADYIARKQKNASEIWAHDHAVTTNLTNNGFKVLRFWESQINSDIQQCISAIYQTGCTTLILRR